MDRLVTRLMLAALLLLASSCPVELASEPPPAEPKPAPCIVQR